MAGLNDALGGAVDKLNSLLGQGSPDWKEQLEKARLDNASLNIIESKESGGHNVAYNQFRGTPGYTEKISTRSENFTVSFFTAGDDWAADRDRILNILRDGERLPYVDPYYGEIIVNVVDWEKTEVFNQGRYAVFAVTFAAAGDIPVLSEISSKMSEASLLEQAAELLQNAVNDITETIDLIGEPARIINAAVARVRGELDNAFAKIKGSILSTVSAWSDLASLFMPGSSGRGGFNKDNYEEIQTKIGEANLDQSLAYADTVSGLNEPDDDTTEARNDAVIRKFFNHSILAVAIERAAEAEFDSYADAVFVRNKLSGLLVDAGLSQYAGDVSVYLTDVAMRLPDLVDHEPFGMSSTIELAQQFYDDPTRADEIRLRNDIRDPAFINFPVKMLSE